MIPTSYQANSLQKYQQKDQFVFQFIKIKTSIFMNIFQISAFAMCLLTGIMCGVPSKKFPVIGILTLRYDESLFSYVNGEYVKLMEISGAQVVPIYAFNSTQAILQLLDKINGVVFPGGSLQFSMEDQWTKNAKIIFEYAKKENDKGNTFPIFGSCLGLQLLSYLSTDGNKSVLTDTPGENGVIHPLQITNETSSLYRYLTPAQLEAISTKKGFSYFHHSFGITEETYNHNQMLKNFWKVTAWTYTDQKLKYVASLQGRKYPFYGLQYHPQITLFQFQYSTNRSTVAVQTAQALSQAFVEQAKQNKNSFASIQDFYSHTIYNTDSTYHPHLKPTTTQIYLFLEDESSVIQSDIQ